MTCELEGNVVSISYSCETDTYLLGCHSGSIYIYNAGNDELKMLRECEGDLERVEFVDSTFYAFSFSDSRQICIGRFDHGNVYEFGLQNSDLTYFHHLSKRNLLLSSFDDGFVRLSCTNRLPNLQALCSIQAEQAGQWVVAIQSIYVSGKEYIITSSRDETVKIWHLVKGRMRLLRVIHTKGIVSSFVYLDNYKILAVAISCDGSDHIDFFKLFSGTLEDNFYFFQGTIQNLFLMKDKDMIGGIGRLGGMKHNSIRFISLHNQNQETFD